MPSEGSHQKTKYAPIQSGYKDWMDQAECRGTPMVKGVSIFFPEIKKSPGRPPRAHVGAPNAEFYKEAIALCRRCPVIHDCEAEYTREPVPRIGMYFGKTPQQRMRLQTRIRNAS